MVSVGFETGRPSTPPKLSRPQHHTTFRAHQQDPPSPRYPTNLICCSRRVKTFLSTSSDTQVHSSPSNTVMHQLRPYHFCPSFADVHHPNLPSTPSAPRKDRSITLPRPGLAPPKKPRNWFTARSEEKSKESSSGARFEWYTAKKAATWRWSAFVRGEGNADVKGVKNWYRGQIMMPAEGKDVLGVTDRVGLKTE